MRRCAVALAVAAMAHGTTGSEPDLVRVPTDTPAPQSAGTAATALGLCGLDYSGRANRYTLTPHDVWPTATKTGQAFANYTLDPPACPHAPVGDRESEPVQGDLGFPSFPDDEQVTELVGSW